jgi:Mg-chelatase subunit ChlD
VQGTLLNPGEIMTDNKNKPIISIGQGHQKKIVSDQTPVIKIGGKAVNQPHKKEVDLIFVIDTTGSMSNKIEGLLATCAKFVDEFAALDLDYRIAVLAFGDLTVPGDKIEITPFTEQIESVKKSLRTIPRYGGGGNEGESSLEALQKAMAQSFRPNAIKVLILITDEPALQHHLRASDMVAKLAQKEFLVFVVSPAIAYYQEMAQKNGGRWYQISAQTDFTDLIEMFEQIASKVSQTVSDVYHIGGGSVAEYLQLKPPDH